MKTNLTPMYSTTPHALASRLNRRALRGWYGLGMLCLLSAPAFAQTSPQPASNVASSTPAATATALPRYQLSELLQLSRVGNLGLQAARAQQLATQSGIRSAQAYPNPEVEWLRNQRQASGTTVPGNGQTWSVLQPIENPWLRAARIETAQARAELGGELYRQAEVGTLADVKLSFYDVLRRQEELKAAHEDKALAEQIRDRIKVRVDTGEGPRFDLVRTEADLAVALNQVRAAELRVNQAKTRLRLAVGPTMAERFELRGELDSPLQTSDMENLKQHMLSTSPELGAARAAVKAAEQNVQVEKQSVLPRVGIRVARETEPELRSNQVGIVVGIPLFDQRRGPVAEASANASRTRFEAEQRRFSIEQQFDAAWQQYVTSLALVQSLETGVVNNAKRAVGIAEAGYRFGERGILEYLDAQRTFRSVRNDLITARYNVQIAKIELERLAGRE